MTPEVAESLSEKALEFARNGNRADIEDLWLSLIEDLPSDPDFYFQVCEAMIKKKLRKPALELLLLAMEQMEKNEDWKLLDQVIFKITTLWPKSDPLRDYAKKALRGRYASSPELEAFLKRCKIDQDVPIDKSVRLFRRLIRLSPGRVYQHPSWGEGIVQSLDLASNKVVLDFPTEKGKVIAIEGVRKFLTYLPPNSFHARRAKDPDELVRLSKEDPVALVKVVLGGSREGLKQSAMKTMLTAGVLTPSGWTSWWTRTRQKLALDAYVDIEGSGGAHSVIRLRSKPRTVRDEVEEIFSDPESTFELRVEAFNKLEASSANEPVANDLIEQILSLLEAAFSAEASPSHSVRLQFAYLNTDLRALGDLVESEGGGIQNAEAVLAEIQDYEPILKVSPLEYQVRALQHLLERDDGESPARIGAIFARSPLRVAQLLWKRLDAPEHLELVTDSLNDLLDAPIPNPSTYFWAARSISEGSWPHLEDAFPASATVMSMLDNLGDWQDIYERTQNADHLIASAKLLTSKVKTYLASNSYRPICQAVESLPLEQAARLRKSLISNEALPEVFRSQADRQILLTRRELDDEIPEAAPDDILYCTELARAQKSRELNDIKIVQMPAVTKAIKEAREEGDLKENAGYHAAKDEQKILMQKAVQLQEALAAAQIVEPVTIDASTITFGTSFDAENKESGDVESFTILGRWEADPDNNILSIQAPMAAQFVGNAAGNDVTIEHPGGGESHYKILSISNALESGRWSIEEPAR